LGFGGLGRRFVEGKFEGKFEGKVPGKTLIVVETRKLNEHLEEK
jgi:hypothetical protein